MWLRDRADAGERLAKVLAQEPPPQPLVLAVPRGGVPIAAIVAQHLNCPWDVVVVRKLALPWNPEAGFGAVAVDGTTVLNPEFLQRALLASAELERIKSQALDEVGRRDRAYRAGRPFPALTGYSVILTDDGLASGYTMLAAVEFAKKSRPREVVVASPVASGAAVRLLQPAVDRLVVLHVSHRWNFAVASFYRDFAQLTDEEVVMTVRGSATGAPHSTT